MYLPHSRRRASSYAALAVMLALAGCTVGPDFVRPAPGAPDDWTSWSNADDSLRARIDTEGALSPQWWRVFEDPVLDALLERAFRAGPDLRTAALHFAQARVQRSTVAAQRGPDVAASGGVTRQRQSEYGAGVRMIDAIGGDRSALVDFLSEPFTLYQAGFDASWEPDLWGRVRRSVEAADAGVAQQAALYDLARLSLASELARSYIELRTTQRQIRLLREDVAALEGRLQILEARVRGGVVDHLDLERQRTEVAASKAQLPDLLAKEGAGINQIALLLGEPPGALRELLAPKP